jgi:hypothetical protein
MKRYNSTPNRLSYTSGKYSPPAKRSTSKHIIALIILAIALAIIGFIYRSCNNNKTLQSTATQHIEKTSDSINKKGSKKMKKVSHKNQDIPVDTTPEDSLPPETNLKIITD